MRAFSQVNFDQTETYYKGQLPETTPKDTSPLDLVPRLCAKLHTLHDLPATTASYEVHYTCSLWLPVILFAYPLGDLGRTKKRQESV
nr:uncharacterized protein LOC129489498 isoform X3 [Symphalangus syndactylus]XP_055148143.1 uncharacterized protein LOC129489498 isoform X3 [Symphalangus syndactylus]